MTNFDFLKNDKGFASFADIAISAEYLLSIDADACVINCRRAMEFALKWIYSVDDELKMPSEQTLVMLMNTEAFKKIAGKDIYKRMDYIRRLANAVAHDGKMATDEQAELCLENLFYFLDFVAYCYGYDYTEPKFDPKLLELTPQEALSFADGPEIDLDKLLEENKALKAELTAHRAEKQKTYVPKPLELSEYGTRKLYIDAMLSDAGWVENKNWRNDVELSGAGRADYVLYGDDGRPLAIIEVKRTYADVSEGRIQAKLYADILEKQYGRRPVVFLSNGFETRIYDVQNPERKVAAIYSKLDLEKLFTIRDMRTSLENIFVNKDIAGKSCQKSAIRALCEAFDKNGVRRALLEMSGGFGKIRTVIALCDVLLRHGWVKNILFLADRSLPIAQAKSSFESLLPDLSTADLSEPKPDYTAHCVFSTYEALNNVVESEGDKGEDIFTCGHFDLVICDEFSRAVCNKYEDIFDSFDALFVGLTVTPQDEMKKDTYRISNLEIETPVNV